MLKVNDKEIMDYGKSMYGRWYANFLLNGKMDGCRENTLTELCNKLGVSKTAMRRDVTRRDN